MNRAGGRSVAEYCIWIACVLAIVSALAPPVLASGGRVSVAVLPFAIAVVALAVNAVTHRQSGLLSALLYAVAVLALLYAMILVLSVPLRLSIEGSCQPAPQPCPLGFDRPLTSAEQSGIYAAVISGGLSLLFTFIAVELQYLRRPLLLNRPTRSAPAPPAAAAADVPRPETPAADAPAPDAPSPAATPRPSAPNAQSESPAPPPEAEP